MGFIFGTICTWVKIYDDVALLSLSTGGFNIIRYGAGPNGPMRTLGQYMLGSGATFGYEASLSTFLAICETLLYKQILTRINDPGFLCL